MIPGRPLLQGAIGLALLSVMSCTVVSGFEPINRSMQKSSNISDRGIGGTGGPNLADRGLGGTGGTAIIGAITGFGSVIVNGFEIASDQNRPIWVDGASTPYAALRIGQIARVVATSSVAGLLTDTVTIEHEVIGQVETGVGDDIVVAGQRVRLRTDTQGETPIVGQWVAVSGFRRSDGEILASRVDEAPPGETLVSGLLVRQGNTLSIGGITIQAGHGTVFASTRVRVRGILAGGKLRSTSIVAAPLVMLQPGLGQAVLQTIASPEGQQLRLGDALDVRRGPALGAIPADRPVIILLLSNLDGSLTATGTLGGSHGSESATQSNAPSAPQPGGPPSSPSGGPGPGPGSHGNGLGGGTGPGGNAGPGNGPGNGGNGDGGPGGGGSGPGGGGNGNAGGGAGGGGGSGGPGR